MKRLMLAATLAALVGSSSGCCLFDRLFGHGGCAACCGKCGPYPACGGPAPNCPPCGPGGNCDGSPGCARSGGDGGPADESAFAGPPTGGVTYPYYTTRGPRDFLATNPRGIGPTP
jgi:hypothetical protein